MKPNLTLLLFVVSLSVITFNSDSQNAPNEGVYASVAGVENIAPINKSSSNKLSKYCTSKANSIAFGWIELLKVGNIEVSTGSNSGYGDLSHRLLEINCGSFNNFEVNSGQPFGTEKQNWRIWIDYDQDGVYTNNEQIVSDYTTHLDALVYIPQQTKETVTTGMRVVMNRDAIPNACGIFEYGEVEDYKVLLKVKKRISSISPVDDVKVSSGILKNNVVVFPNPATVVDEMSVQLTHDAQEDVELSVFSIDGRLMWNNKVSIDKGKHTLDIWKQEKSKGVYLLKIRSQSNTLIKKFTVIE